MLNILYTEQKQKRIVEDDCVLFKRAVVENGVVSVYYCGAAIIRIGLKSN